MGAFFGRDAEIAELTYALTTGNRRIVGVVGIGGQGKTALSLHVALQLEGKEFDSVVWATAADGKQLTLNELLNAIASVHNYPYEVQRRLLREKERIVRGRTLG